ncbi:hypothetical protein FGLOB1_7857 [Fusarium globosum]|uniref:Uncharacterized protein n=1 Tax=Fusarium globosum TaxID=78864 RepID=A0A8H5Y6K8_9HYPO|nr:hypothetical protein FGLOB1_7857 [Fusarium globosum]
MAKENNFTSKGPARPSQTRYNFRKTSKRCQHQTKPSSTPSRLASNYSPSEDEISKDNDTENFKGENESVRSRIVSTELSSRGLEIAPAIPGSYKNTLSAASRARLNYQEGRLRQSNSDSLKKKNFSATLLSRLFDTERRYNDLESSVALSNRVQDPSSEMIQLRETISALKIRLERESLLSENYKALGADRLGFIHIRLEDQYAQLYSIINDTCGAICDLSEDDTLPDQRTGFSQLANNWATRINGYDLVSLLCHCELAQIPKKMILISLLSASIFNLVLEKIFPDFLAAESPLLDQYRKHIETQSKHSILFTLNLACCETDLTKLGGWKALQQLDIISIKSFLSVEHAKETCLSENSEWLSSLVLENLGCFLPLESQDMTQSSSHSELETETMGEMRAVFGRALTLKFELILSAKRFKYLFFRPGTAFDAKKMDVVQDQARDSVLLSQAVKICLLPALFTLSEENNESEVGEISSYSASYSKALEEVRVEDIDTLVLVEKAVVFL